MTDNKVKVIEMVDVDLQNQCLQTAIYEISKTHPFMGSVLQCLNITYTYALPTAGIHFDIDGKKWQMDINPHFYCKQLNAKHRQAILLHELMHITNKHPIRVPFLKISPSKRSLMNIAADMAINQFIKNIPNGCKQCPPKEQRLQGATCTNELCPGICINVEDYSDKDEKTNIETPWPVNKTMEFYYEKLLRMFENASYPDECSVCGTPLNGESEDGSGQSTKSDGNGESEDGSGQSGKGSGNGICPKCGKEHGKGRPQEYDQHNWGEGGDENEMLDSTEELVKRAMIKQSISYDELPGHIKELLNEIDSRRSELNYRALILQAIKRSASGHERKSTWTRKSKRFGNMSPGTRVGDLPELSFFIDTSGSISIEEGNEFLGIADNFLKVGVRKCWLSMFHTMNYYHKKYRLGQRIDKRDWQSGGTCLENSLRLIADKRPDLAVFLTDGYYSDVDVESWLPPGQKFPQCLFIISKGGEKNHPLRRLGKTIVIPNSNLLADDKRLEEQ